MCIRDRIIAIVFSFLHFNAYCAGRVGSLLHGNSNVISSATFSDVTVQDDLLVYGGLFVGQTIVANSFDIIGTTSSASDLTVTNNLSVDNTITTQTLDVGCDLVVGCNIEMVDSTDIDHGKMCIRDRVEPIGQKNSYNKQH